MSYDIVNDGLSNLIKKIGYASTRYPSFDNVPSDEIPTVFIIGRISGENNESASETISSLIYDVQLWEVQFALQKSNADQGVNYDQLNRLVDLLIKTIDNPANWESFPVRSLKYLNWNIADDPKKSYWVLTMQFRVEDTIVY